MLGLLFLLAGLLAWAYYLKRGHIEALENELAVLGSRLRRKHVEETLAESGAERERLAQEAARVKEEIGRINREIALETERAEEMRLRIKRARNWKDL